MGFLLGQVLVNAHNLRILLIKLKILLIKLVKLEKFSFLCNRNVICLLRNAYKLQISINVEPNMLFILYGGVLVITLFVS